MAPFSNEDKILIKSLYKCKGYNARQFITEFPGKGWNLGLDARVCVQDSCRRRQWDDRLLVKSVSGHHRRHNRPVASVTPSVCEGQGTPL